MKRFCADGRIFTPTLTARGRSQGAEIELVAPAVGLWRDAPAPGSLVTPGGDLGQLEVLGVLHRVRAPDDAGGLVQPRPGPRLARQPVGYGDVLVRLDPEARPTTAGLSTTQAAAESAAGVPFRSPLSGRFYARPSPDKPTFVKVGDIIETGRTVALLEVMKTFNRIAYGGEGLPARARVVAVGPGDEDDVDEGDVLLRVEPA